ncbi:hypothetical protein EJ03DRAFT_327924 [Teratosphaeria nubilosa]|uniref:Secreted protein n=1 Tax=Teratosphaeria nubilosa TaxID=161662 RepID=A0A6G1L897_9PEZI|nr:hypothetical protein EJ03DRAFT_327924 [Teratosphaeria nubilosa]
MKSTVLILLVAGFGNLSLAAPRQAPEPPPPKCYRKCKPGQWTGVSPNVTPLPSLCYVADLREANSLLFLLLLRSE